MNGENGKKTKALSFPTKIGYSIGQLSDSNGFSLWLYFFLFFLTDCAGISPGIAGTIILVAGIWDAVTDPVMGYLSDNMHSRFGRRRPLMIAGCIPYAICTYLLFTNVDFGENGKIAYFLVIAIVFWSAYKTYVLPYFALGAEIATDFDERTSLRSWAGIFIYVAVLLASVLPPIISDKVTNMTGSLDTGWSSVGLLFAFLIFIPAFICWNATRGKEPKSDQNEGKSESNFLRNFFQILKLKPILFLSISVFAWGMVTNLLGASLIYLMENNLKFSAEKVSGFFLYMSIVTIALIPVINFLAKKFDKKNVYVLAMLLGFTVFTLFGILGLPSFGILIFFITFIQFGDGTFWTLYYAMMYDISELDEFLNDKRREGTITSVLSFTQKIGAAFAGFLLGQLLSFSGYDAFLEVQSAAAQNMILYTTTFIPGIFALIAAVTAIFYPITKGRFHALMEALEAKRKGKAYDTKGFEKLLWKGNRK